MQVVWLSYAAAVMVVVMSLSMLKCWSLMLMLMLEGYQKSMSIWCSWDSLCRCYAMGAS